MFLFFAGIYTLGKADIRNPLSLLAHERSRFATCQWELLTPTDISIPLTHRLVLYALEAGECLFCVQKKKPYENFFSYDFMKYFFKSYTNSRTTSIAPSPLRRPILTILVYPPLRSAYLGAISSNNFATRSTSFVFFFFPACAVGTSFTG